jgi:phosphoribosylanthranilate isomerase
MIALFEEKSFLIKVCGLVREEDVRLCLDLGVDMTGFIFVPSSPRYISPESAARLSKGRAARIGVFAGQSVDFVHTALSVAGLDYAQLHGGEDAGFCRAVGPERVIKVLWPQRLLRATGPDGKNAGGASSGRTGGADTSGRPFPPSAGVAGSGLTELLREECSRFSGACSIFLLDAGTDGGGSGNTLPWAMLKEFVPDLPWLLAGGIGPGTVREALTTCSPWGIDCNSGVEDVPGRKNPQLLRALVNNARKGSFDEKRLL